MLRWRVRIEAQPRSKNGHPAQSTIGAVSASCTQADQACGTRWRPSMSAPIETISKGIASAPATQSRRVKSISSGLGASSSEGSSGSSAIPQIRSEEHTSELQYLMRFAYAVFDLNKKKHEEHRNSTDRTAQK